MKALMLSTGNRMLHTKLGCLLIDLTLRATQYRVFSPRTVHAMQFDLLRLRARSKHGRSGTRSTYNSKLHFGCGTRKVDGWLNVDVSNSDEDVDLADGRLPWDGSSFVAIVSQHTVEHLELKSELLPLMKELERVAKPDCELWLSCPDMLKICNSYIIDRGEALLADRDRRMQKPSAIDSGIPTQHYINEVFVQRGEHQNLLDFDMMQWLCSEAGFHDCRLVEEEDFLSRFPEFPRRDDDLASIYIRATKPVENQIA